MENHIPRPPIIDAAPALIDYEPAYQQTDGYKLRKRRRQAQQSTLRERFRFWSKIGSIVIGGAIGTGLGLAIARVLLSAP